MRLSNPTLPSGDTLWASLTAENLRFAKLEVAELLVDPDKWRAPDSAAEPWWDLRSYPGGATEHQYEFVGEVVSARQVSPNEIQLTGARKEPTIDWPEALQDDTDAGHLGTRLPVPIGTVLVPCVNLKLPFRTTLAEPLKRREVGILKQLTSGLGITANTDYRLLINDEEVQATTQNDPSRVLISERGLAGSKQGRHPAGATVLPKDEAIFGCSGYPISGVKRFFLRAPLGDQLVGFDEVEGVPADSGVEPGRSIATVRFDSEAFVGMVQSMAQSTDVTQQGVYQAGGGGVPTSITVDPPNGTKK
ncbi:MAG: hypothetical protein GY953_23505, partial [bacterium]|nr:hypothetical protein [bacterium]